MRKVLSCKKPLHDIAQKTQQKENTGCIWDVLHSSRLWQGMTEWSVVGHNLTDNLLVWRFTLKNYSILKKDL